MTALVTFWVNVGAAAGKAIASPSEVPLEGLVPGEPGHGGLREAGETSPGKVDGLDRMGLGMNLGKRGPPQDRQRWSSLWIEGSWPTSSLGFEGAVEGRVPISFFAWARAMGLA